METNGIHSGKKFCQLHILLAENEKCINSFMKHSSKYLLNNQEILIQSSHQHYSRLQWLRFLLGEPKILFLPCFTWQVLHLCQFYASHQRWHNTISYKFNLSLHLWPWLSWSSYIFTSCNFEAERETEILLIKWTQSYLIGRIVKRECTVCCTYTREISLDGLFMRLFDDKNHLMTVHDVAHQAAAAATARKIEANSEEKHSE